MRDMNRRDGTTFIFSKRAAEVMAHATVVRIADGNVTAREAVGGAAAAGAR